MERIPHLDAQAIRERLMERPVPALAMYSSWWGGITTDSAAMQVPADDHLVHRGDGVFETLKVCRGAVYNMERHLDRLRLSCRRLGLERRWTDEEVEQIIVETVEAAGDPEALVRVIAARGPGGFSVSPADCAEAVLYVIVYPASPPFMAQHPEGARVAMGDVPGKPSFFATVKTCNYLPNALLKQAALDQGVHFLLGRDPEGNVTEGPTENVCVVTPDRVLVRVPSEHILLGTTMMRVLELAGPLMDEGQLTDIGICSLSPADLERATEILILGTTAEVTAVVEFNGRPVGDGRPGVIQQELARRLREDMEACSC